jgi:zinc D-Ala-D-Ala dipeptidase
MEEEDVRMSASGPRHVLPRSAVLIFSAAVLCSAPACSPAQEPALLRDARDGRSDLVEIARFDSTIRYDIRYATSRNFLGRPVYTQARALLQRPAALALARVQRRLAAQGYGLLVFDAYRPWSVTKIFWDETPPSQREFVADPRKGSRHNRGCAVDLTLLDLSTGLEVRMPSAYDDFTPRAYVTSPGIAPEERHRRDLLRGAMEAEGFQVEALEWWHYDYRDWASYPLLDISFDQIP